MINDSEKTQVKFTHLHTHWESSYLDGILRYKNLDKVKALGFDSIAVTDHGSLSGTYEFYKECKKVGIKPILGNEAYYSISHRSLKNQDDLGGSRPNYHMILLAQNKIGWKNLVKMNSKAYTEGFYYNPRIDDELIAEYNVGLISSSACLGSRLSKLILKNMKEDAKKLIEHHAAIFKDRYFLELQCHSDEEQLIVNGVLMEFAKELNLPLILTADSHYFAFEDKKLHDKFLCISTNSKLEDKKRFNFGSLDCHLASPETMEKKRILWNLPEEAITNTMHLAAMCTPDYFSDIVNRYPTYKDKPSNISSDDYLDMLVKMKWLERSDNQLPSQEVRERVEHELKIIKKMGFSDYFLIRYDLVKAAEEMNILEGPGRGSAAGSMVAYILGITKVDPIKYGLLFSRMLNEGRGQIPVIF